MSTIASIKSMPVRAVRVQISGYLLLLLIGLPLLVIRLDQVPAAWFDEGYKTNAARTLAEHGIYGTYTTNGYLPFDPGISSGPVDVLAVALSFQLLGRGVAQARLVSVLFTLIALFSLYTLAVQLYGRRAGLTIMLFMIAVPTIQDTSFLLLGRQILGEPPALALLSLGLLLWFWGWTRPNWTYAAASGFLIGLGLLSKTQLAIPLLPCLVIVVAARWRKLHTRLLHESLVIILILLVLGSWWLIGVVTSTPAIRQENSTMLAEAIRTNLITSLFGRTLSTQALVIVVIMSVGGIYGLRHLRAPARLNTPVAWMELTLGVFLILETIWFALFSVGWPRYAYTGLVWGLLLVGKLLWDLFHLGSMSIKRIQIVSVFLGLVAIFSNVYPTIRYPASGSVQEVAAYIDNHLPSDAVIESWEWELDALSAHWQYHHPHQHYLFEAIRQYSHEQVAFDLQYDLLQANPDYLITGAFSDWTGIYRPQAVSASFELVTEIGSYRIYKRIRE